jgi:phosphatidylserine/phosphatidylglycerophosphate/cardiolipin synthase-like enzyme
MITADNKIGISICLALLIAIGSVSSCTSKKQPLYREQLDVARFQQAECPDPNDSTCFSHSPFGALVAEAFSGKEDAPQYVNFLSRGDEALIARVHLIRSARRSILFQTFIWGDDEASNFFFMEMYRAAERGVKVQIIVDQMGAKAQIDSLRQAAVAHENLEIKLYNPVRGKAKLSSRDMANAAATQFQQLNQRMHNKLLVVDGRIAVTGGRNIENKYFDLDSVYTFKDRDVLVVGPVVSYMKRSFTEYWKYEESIPLAEVSDVSVAEYREPEAVPPENQAAYYETKPALREYGRLAASAGYIEKTFIQKAYEVRGRVMFHADNPGKLKGDENSLSEYTSREIEKAFLESETSLVMQTPYLVFSKQSLKFLKALRKKNPDFEIIASSNSLAAADHIYVYGVAFKQKKKLVKNLGFRIYELKPVPGDVRQMIPRYDALSELKIEKGLADYDAFLPTGTGTRVGIHSKSMVLDDNVAWVGSHNFDPRSENLNTEAGVMIWDEAVAGRLKADILLDCAPQNSWLVAKKKQVPVISYFSGIIGSISRALPVFDIWPFRYTTSYELNQGMAAVPFGHPDFFTNYTDKQAFPGINMSGRAMQTRLITAMGGFITPFI